jgi:hypothetical protein
MSTTIVMAARFDEIWTVRLDTDGTPVQRTLREMTAGEVMHVMYSFR